MSVPAVGNVQTPAGFIIQSAQGQVLLSWQITPLATIYYVNRSDDGVSFANIGETTSLSYSDDTGDSDVAYYYQIQAGNGTFSSLPTASLQGQNLLPGQTTVGNLRLQCQQRADKQNNPFITDQEWNSMISASHKELYDKLVAAYGDDYYVAEPYSFDTNGSDQRYALPDDFYKLLGCEVALNPQDPNSWVSLRKFEFIQRNLWNYPNVYTFYGITNLRYRVNGNYLMLVPIASANTTIRLWYIPRPNELINDTDIVDGVSGWEEYIIADVCIKALTKSEDDVTVFAAQLAKMDKRIEGIATNRDVGEPETVSDSRTRNFAWSDDNGPGGSGGWW